ncbi:sporulation-induced protein [Balamuthia mandrillaris]
MSGEETNSQLASEAIPKAAATTPSGLRLGGRQLSKLTQESQVQKIFQLAEQQGLPLSLEVIFQAETEDVLWEAKTGNPKLLDFLNREDTMKALLRYATNNGKTFNEAAMRQQATTPEQLKNVEQLSKYINLSCELLALEGTQGKIFSEDNFERIMDALFEFADDDDEDSDDSDDESEFLLTAQFSAIAQVYLLQSAERSINYLVEELNSKNFVRTVKKNLHQPALADLLLSVVWLLSPVPSKKTAKNTVPSESLVAACKQFNEWLNEGGFVEALIEYLIDPESSPEGSINASQTLQELIMLATRDLQRGLDLPAVFTRLIDDSTLEKLVPSILALTDEATFSIGILVILELLKYEAIALKYEEKKGQKINAYTPLIRLIESNLNLLVNRLSSSSSPSSSGTASLTTSFSDLVPRSASLSKDDMRQKLLRARELLGGDAASPNEEGEQQGEQEKEQANEKVKKTTPKKGKKKVRKEKKDKKEKKGAAAKDRKEKKTKEKKEKKTKGKKAEQLPQSKSATTVRASTVASIDQSDSPKKKMTTTATNKTSTLTTKKTSEKPFGLTRIRVLGFCGRLIAHCVANPSCHGVLEEFDRLHFWDIIINLFFTFTWNNFAHNVIEKVLTIIITAPPTANQQELKKNILLNYSLLNMIVEADSGNQRDCKVSPANRRGYMGALTELSINILKAAENDPYFNTILQEHEGWTQYAQTSLAEARRLQEGSDSLFVRPGKRPTINTNSSTAAAAAGRGRGRGRGTIDSKEAAASIVAPTPGSTGRGRGAPPPTPVPGGEVGGPGGRGRGRGGAEQSDDGAPSLGRGRGRGRGTASSPSPPPSIPAAGSGSGWTNPNLDESRGRGRGRGIFIGAQTKSPSESVDEELPPLDTPPLQAPTEEEEVNIAENDIKEQNEDERVENVPTVEEQNLEATDQKEEATEIEPPVDDHAEEEKEAEHTVELDNEEDKQEENDVAAAQQTEDQSPANEQLDEEEQIESAKAQAPQPSQPSRQGGDAPAGQGVFRGRGSPFNRGMPPPRGGADRGRGGDAARGGPAGPGGMFRGRGGAPGAPGPGSVVRGGDPAARGGRGGLPPRGGGPGGPGSIVRGGDPSARGGRGGAGGPPGRGGFPAGRGGAVGGAGGPPGRGGFPAGRGGASGGPPSGAPPARPPRDNLKRTSLPLSTAPPVDTASASLSSAPAGGGAASPRDSTKRASLPTTSILPQTEASEGAVLPPLQADIVRPLGLKTVPQRLKPPSARGGSSS